MIELCFGESPAGSLAAAKISPKRDVLPLTLALDVGDLRDLDGNMDGRKNALSRLFGAYRDVTETLWAQNEKTLLRLREAALAADAVRLWLRADDPGEVCGLYYACHFFCGSDAPLRAVFLPACAQTADAFIEYRSSGELPPEALGALAGTARALSPWERRAYADKWRALAEESAPLRAVVNGRVVGVREDFYDFLLRANLPEGEFTLARVIGKTLSALPGVHDRWLFLRLMAFKEAGEIAEVRPGGTDHPYAGVWRKK